MSAYLGTPNTHYLMYTRSYEGINGATLNNVERFPSGIKLCKLAGNWDLLRNVSASSQIWNKDTEVYTSSHTFASRDVIYSVNPANQKLYGIFLNSSGRIRLKDTVAISSVHRANAYLEEDYLVSLGSGNDLRLGNWNGTKVLIPDSIVSYPAAFIVNIDDPDGLKPRGADAGSETPLRLEDLLQFFYSPFDFLESYDASWTNSGWVGYGFNNNTTDLSGNGRSLVLFGGASFSSDSQYGSHALSVDGARGNYAQVDSGPVNLGNTFGISCWIKRASDSTAVRGAICSNRNGGGRNSGFRISVKTDGVVEVQVGDGSSSKYLKTDSGAVPMNEWVYLYIDFRRNQGNDGKSWVGIRVFPISSSHSTYVWDNEMPSHFENNALLKNGKEGTDPQTGYKGLVDDFKIYQRESSKEEVGYLMFHPY